MTQDPRIDRLEERVEGLANEVRELRPDFRSLRSEVNSRFNLMVLMWMTTIGSIIGLFFRTN